MKKIKDRGNNPVFYIPSGMCCGQRLPETETPVEKKRRVIWYGVGETQVPADLKVAKARQ